jgi:hypothetical protein
MVEEDMRRGVGGVGERARGEEEDERCALLSAPATAQSGQVSRS